MTSSRVHVVGNRRGVLVAWLLAASGVAVSFYWGFLQYSGWADIAGFLIAVAGGVVGKIASGRLWPFLIIIVIAALPMMFTVFVILTWNDT